tara:strand:- start:159 stop:500 length:342 start_codon:yes stop_codon:yes gene_type:complete
VIEEGEVRTAKARRRGEEEDENVDDGDEEEEEEEEDALALNVNQQYFAGSRRYPLWVGLLVSAGMRYLSFVSELDEAEVPISRNWVVICPVVDDTIVMVVSTSREVEEEQTMT